MTERSERFMIWLDGIEMERGMAIDDRAESIGMRVCPDVYGVPAESINGIFYREDERTLLEVIPLSARIMNHPSVRGTVCYRAA